MMKAELKAKWIKALRSGKYEQGSRKLISLGDRFCCLGVLCEVAGFPRRGYGYEFDGIVGYAESALPIDVRDQMGLKDFASRLILMNDSENKKKNDRDFDQLPETSPPLSGSEFCKPHYILKAKEAVEACIEGGFIPAQEIENDQIG